MARFTYHGPRQTISMKIGTAKDGAGNDIAKFKDFDFVPGEEIENLPEGNPIVASLVARELLKPLPEKPSSSKKGDDK